MTLLFNGNKIFTDLTEPFHAKYFCSRAQQQGIFWDWRKQPLYYESMSLTTEFPAALHIPYLNNLIAEKCIKMIVYTVCDG